MYFIKNSRRIIFGSFCFILSALWFRDLIQIYEESGMIIYKDQVSDKEDDDGLLHRIFKMENLLITKALKPSEERWLQSGKESVQNEYCRIH